MQTVQLYINDIRVDLFKDESISLTESIRNSRDIAKVFTTFTKQFTIPSSRENNKLFKHFYNYNIVGGFDARVTQSARIEIDNLPFKDGRVKLNGVKMKNNKPFAYNITFFGSIIDLKDILGEDKLPDLTALGSYALGYSNSDILTALQAAPGETALPLVTANQQLYYDSTDTDAGTGNLYYNASYVRGLNPRQLKYAIRLDKIIDAIETKYSGITFAANSFFKDATKDIHKLYMWCHRKKDEISIVAGAVQVVGGFNPSENATSVVLKVQSDTQGVMIDESTRTADVLTFETTTSSSTVKYDLAIYRDTGSGYVLYQEQNGNYGNKVLTVLDPLVDGYKYKAYVKTYDSDITFSAMKWKCTYSGATSGYDEFSVSNKTFSSSFEFNVQEQIPEMTIINFLSSLFKMFNLVAYVNTSGEIDVQPLDDFYTSTEHDITDYVDVTDSEVNVALPFKEIFFKYKDTKTILAAQHLQEIANVDWGGVEYTTTDELYGDIYKVEPAFNHSKFERLLDLSNTALNTGVQYGYYVDDNQDGYLGDPFIMYINQNQVGVDISINDNGVLGQISSSTSINMPSNLEDMVDETSNNIHFNAELSEYDGQLAEETLFKRFYESYIVNIFDVDNRITKVTAYLPKSKLVKGGNQIELSDIIIINENKYRINAMNINPLTGKTEFELINYYD